jgi:H+/Cl- antiporter ClcA
MLRTTVDWVQDAAREQARRKSRRRRVAGLFDNGQPGWRYRLWESYDAAQGWIVVTLIGAAIGLNAAFLNIVTEWLSDIKLGYCTTAFYLNENFCCWGEDNGKRCGFLAKLRDRRLIRRQAVMTGTGGQAWNRSTTSYIYSLQ